ncbi:MAG: hypothetical protein MI807_03960 [Verrucomicrobiales bacterium]|nr:hypothetical protein [Verrucomicrobiales bacterium]
MSENAIYMVWILFSVSENAIYMVWIPYSVRENAFQTVWMPFSVRENGFPFIWTPRSGNSSVSAAKDYEGLGTFESTQPDKGARSRLQGKDL